MKKCPYCPERGEVSNTVEAFHKWLLANADIVDDCRRGEEWTLWNAYVAGYYQGRQELNEEQTKGNRDA